jgi:hypothetical protein
MREDPEMRTTVYTGFRHLIRDPETHNWVLDPDDPILHKQLNIGRYAICKYFVFNFLYFV